MQQEEIRFRNPVEQHGFAVVYHVLTLDRNLSDGAFRLYALLLKYAQQKDRAYPGVARLASDLGVSEKTIKNRLAELERARLISRQRRFGSSSITWIEALQDAYDMPEQMCEGVENYPIEQVCEGVKSYPSMGQNFTPKEQEEEEQQERDGGGFHPEQKHALNALVALGVSAPVAIRLAGARDPTAVQGWCDYAGRANGIRDPAAFVVHKLKIGDDPPGRQDDHDRYVGGKYAEFVVS